VGVKMELKSLSEGWEIVNLGNKEFFKRYGGGTPKRDKREYWMGGAIPWVTNNELEENKINYMFSTKEKITEKGLKNSSATLIPERSVLLSCTASIGKVGINEIKLATNQQFNSYVCSGNRVLPEFLAYFFLTIKQQLEKIAGTTTFRHIIIPNLEKVNVPLPSLEEQKQIVEILQFADHLREKIKEAKELSDKIVMSEFFDMFGDPATNPKGWEVKKLSEIADINPRNLLSESWNDEKEVGFIPMENIDEEIGEIRRVGIKELNQVRSGKTRFKEKDVLFAKITPCVENKKVALVRNLPSEIGFGSTEFHVLRAKDDITVPNFLLYLARTDYVREQAISSMTGTSGRKRVPASFLKNFDVPLPSLDLQQEFAEIVSKLEDKRKKMEEAEEKLEMLYQILLKQAFTGKLTEEWRMKGNNLEGC
jgi:restriction endonuclease S subunit